MTRTEHARQDVMVTDTKASCGSCSIYWFDNIEVSKEVYAKIVAAVKNGNDMTFSSYEKDRRFYAGGIEYASKELMNEAFDALCRVEIMRRGLRDGVSRQYKNTDFDGKVATIDGKQYVLRHSDDTGNLKPLYLEPAQKRGKKSMSKMIIVNDPVFGHTSYKINAPDFDGKFVMINGDRYMKQNDTGYFELIKDVMITTKTFQPRHRFRSDEEWEKANELDYPSPEEAKINARAAAETEGLRLKIQEGIRKNMAKTKEIAP